MAYLLKPNIFSYFGSYAKRVDVNKDGFDKGSWERYQESLGEGYDVEIQPLLDLLLDNTIVPGTLLAKLIPTVEKTLGDPVIVLFDGSQPALAETLRRKVIEFAHKIYNIKSTELSYQILFNLLGIPDVTIVSYVNVAGFDSDATFDDPERFFDGANSCTRCRQYSIVATGTTTLTPNIIAGLSRIVRFLEPINATLREFTYNGDVIDLVNIVVYVEDGVIYFDNSNDPGIILTLIDGVLHKSGYNADKYTFSEVDGILYLITT